MTAHAHPTRLRSVAAGNIATIADAGADQQVTTGQVVTLTGASWRFQSKPAGSTANASTVSPTFTADITGFYGLSLIVDDGQVSTRSQASYRVYKPSYHVLGRTTAQHELLSQQWNVCEDRQILVVASSTIPSDKAFTSLRSWTVATAWQSAIRVTPWRKVGDG